MSLRHVPTLLGCFALTCILLGWRTGAVSGMVQLDPMAECRAVDGDTISCRKVGGGRERYRLNGIDAAEMPGHCRPGRLCVEGDPYLSQRSLEAGMDQGPLTAELIKRDRYGRWIAEVKAGKVDLSCFQLANGQAKYKRQWDEGGRVARCN